MADGDALELERSVLRSDLLRTALLVAVVVVMLAGNIVIGFITPLAMPPVLRAHLGALLFLLALATAYEAASFAILRRAIHRGVRPRGLRYVNAVVEVTLPTIVIAVLAQGQDGLILLHAPAPFVYLLLILLSTLHLDVKVCVWTGALAAIQYGALAWYFSVGDHPGLDPLLVNPAVHVAKAGIFWVAGLLAAFVAHQLRRRFVEALAAAGARNQVVAVFGQHVSPAVVDRLLAVHADDDAGELRRVCVMFLDVRGFTAYASGRPPAEVMAHLNALFGPMIDTVNRHQGIINKFLGDGFMAVFGAPIADDDACAHAVAAALAIVRELDDAIAAGRIAATQIGIGLHAGDAMTGSVGSPARKEYTVIGDAVNLASRIEGLTKQVGARVLASEAVWRALAAPPDGAAPLGPMSVKGVAEPVAVYKLA